MRHTVVVGGGWAGLAAAVQACGAGHAVTVLEASPHWGGRARRVVRPWPADVPNPQGHADWSLDNGQHILIGAYRATLGLMERVGLAPERLLHALPLTLPFPDGRGLVTPGWARHWPARWRVLAAIATARGWRATDKLALLTTLARWQRQRFTAPAQATVADLCDGLPATVIDTLIDPLCVAALNTPLTQASASVFLRVLHDALHSPGHGPWQAADLLLPTRDLGQLLPDAAVHWLAQQGATLATGQRVVSLQRIGPCWQVERHGAAPLQADAVVLACPAPEAARLAESAADPGSAPALRHWSHAARSLRHEAIATVYLHTPHRPKALATTPMLALRSGAGAGPAQFVFDRTALGANDAGGTEGCLLAFVASASQGDRIEVQAAVGQQARTALGIESPTWMHTVIEKRATFACTPGLTRPPTAIAPGLAAAGDYVAGPYPATLEGAVLNGQAAVEWLNTPAA